MGKAHPLTSRVARAAPILCVCGALVGFVGLLGWLIEESALTTVVRGQPAMQPNTGAALILLGIGAALRHRTNTRRVARALSTAAALAVLVIGIGTLAEYAFSVELGIDTVLLSPSDGPHPGRPSPFTALALSLLAATLLSFDFRSTARPRPSEWLAMSAGVSAFVGFMGFVYGAETLYREAPSPVRGMAVHSAVGLVLISLGMLLERPNEGIMREAIATGPGGTLLRRLVPAVVLGPILLKALLSSLLGALGFDDRTLMFATLASSTTVLGLFLLFVTAPRLNRAHEALESARAQWRNLVEEASDGIFVADLEGRYLDVNSAGSQMLGCDRDDIIGKKIVDLIPPKDVERLWASRKELLDNRIHVAEWALRRKDGEYLPVEVSAKILPDGRWQAIVRDISGRKRSEAALKQAQERFELALRGADLAAWDWNIQSGEVVFSSRWAEMRGYRPEEVKPHMDSWIGGIHPEDWPRVKKHLDDYFQGLTPEYEAELRVKTKWGRWIWILDRGKVFARDENGQPIRMVGTELDITARKRVEDELRRAIQSRDEVLGIVAHDLRTPLGTILMQAALLGRGAPREPDERIRTAAEAIERSATRMSRLIQDLLDVTRMEARALTIQPSRLRTAQLLFDAVQAESALASSRSIDLRFEHARNLPDIWGDRDRLLQIFENLIGNALKFTEPGGHVSIGTVSTGDDVVFWIKDTGSGIPAADLPHIFDRFWQARRDDRGAGLGLPIVKGLVEAHGGRIWIDSEPGRGSTFFFTIPAAPRVEEWRPTDSEAHRHP